MYKFILSALKYNIYDVMLLLDINIPSYSTLLYTLNNMSFESMLNSNTFDVVNFDLYFNKKYINNMYPNIMSTVEHNIEIDFKEIYDKGRI